MPTAYEPMALRARSHVRPMVGKRRPLLIEASDGHPYVIKVARTPEHGRLLVNEFLAAHLLSALGISVPPSATIHVTEQFLNDHRSRTAALDQVEAGLYCGSQYPFSCTTVIDCLPPQLAARVANLDQFWKMSVIDHWTAHLGPRRAIFVRAEEHGNTGLPGQYVALMIGGSGMFGGGSWTLSAEPHVSPYFKDLLEDASRAEALQAVVENVLGLSEDDLRAIWMKTPAAWYMDDQKAYEDLLQALLDRRCRLPQMFAPDRFRSLSSLNVTASPPLDAEDSKTTEETPQSALTFATFRTCNGSGRILTGKVSAPATRTRTFFVAAILLAGLLGGLWLAFRMQTPRPLSPKQYAAYKKAQSDLENLQPEAARNGLKDLVQQVTGFVGAYLSLAEADTLLFEDSKQAGLLAEAGDALEDARRWGAVSGDLLLPEARLSLAKGQPEQCVMQLSPTAPNSPSDDLHRTLSSCHAAAGQWPQALNEANVAIRINPSEWKNHNAYAKALVRTNQLAKAAFEYGQVLKQHPSNANILSNLGAVYLQLGRYGEATDTLTRSLDLAPSYQAYSNLAVLYYRIGHCALAEPLFKRAWELRHQGMLMEYLAEAERCEGAEDQAVVDFVQAVGILEKEQHSVKTDEGQALLALAYVRVGRLSEAEEEITRSAKNRRRDLVLYASAILNLASNRVSDALQSLDAAIRAGYPLTNVSMDRSWRGLEHDSRYRALVRQKTGASTR